MTISPSSPSLALLGSQVFGVVMFAAAILDPRTRR